MVTSPEFEPVIGLEVHAQLLTGSKAFCGCKTEFGGEPNSNVCPVCLGLPGVLPVLNATHVEMIVKMGLATGCAISRESIFARKNYYYPDLPKGYQISQYDQPVCSGGRVEIDPGNGVRKTIGITRIHMEEDAGKSIHDQGPATLVDVNRCGVPLIEIVSEPDLRTPHEAYLYMHKIRQILVYLGICDGIMEEGSLRCDANVSVREVGTTAFGTKTEVKNLNSFRNVERAIECEVERQIKMIRNGEPVVQQTLLWDADRGSVHPMRSKEEAHDYRYFPDPDLPPVLVDEALIEKVRSGLPEHPTARRDRFIAELGLPTLDADILTAEKSCADYFEEVVRNLQPATPESTKSASNWVMTEVLRALGERKISIDEFAISPARLASMIGLITNGTISGKIAKDVFEAMLTSPDDPMSIVTAKGWTQLSDPDAIETVIRQMLGRHQSQVEQYRNGDEKLLGFFVGQVMKATGGKANPGMVNSLLKKILHSPN